MVWAIKERGAWKVRQEDQARGARGREIERTKTRECMVKMASLYRNEKMGEEKPMRWRSLE